MTTAEHHAQGPLPIPSDSAEKVRKFSVTIASLATSFLHAVLVLASFAFVGIQLDREGMLQDDTHRWIGLLLYCFGIIYLHWSLWRLLVPCALVDDPGARFLQPTRLGFYHGTISWGYLMLIGYGAMQILSSVEGPHPPRGMFWLPVVLILVGTAARVREVIVRLATRNAAYAAFNHAQGVGDPPALHANI